MLRKNMLQPLLYRIRQRRSFSSSSSSFSSASAAAAAASSSSSSASTSFHRAPAALCLKTRVVERYNVESAESRDAVV